MIRIVLNSSRQQEIRILKEQFREQAAYQTDETLEIHDFEAQELLAAFVETGELLDVICMDVTMPKAVSFCETVRERCPGSFLVLIATGNISPVTYMKPTIMASSLLLRPFGEDEARTVASELIRLIETAKDSSDEALVVKTKDGKSRIPYSAIRYMESREKKIYACTAVKEYSFYSTIEQMEEELPGNFVRCHRSYIVNQDCIENVQLSKGILILTGDIYIPVSRKYKNVLKEYMS